MSFWLDTYLTLPHNHQVTIVPLYICFFSLYIFAFTHTDDHTDDVPWSLVLLKICPSENWPIKTRKTTSHSALSLPQTASCLERYINKSLRMFVALVHQLMTFTHPLLLVCWNIGTFSPCYVVWRSRTVYLSVLCKPDQAIYWIARCSRESNKLRFCCVMRPSRGENKCYTK